MTENFYNFDEYIDRNNTRSVKWDEVSNIFQKPDLLPLWVADMDFLSPRPVIDAIIRRAKHGVYGYSFFPHQYYEAIINWFKRRHGWSIEKDWLCYTPGVIPGVNFTLQAFSQPSDKVIIQNPAYPPFFSAVRNNNRRRLLNPLLLSNGRYEMDFKDLEKKAKEPRVKILILCNPHNPTGRSWSKEDLTCLGEICLENQILVLSDEIHCDLIYPEYKHTPFASISEKFAQNSITCTSPSKTFNLPGLKVSNIIIPNPKLRNTFKKVVLSTGISGANCFGPIALETAYNECEDWLDKVILYVRENLEFLKNFMKKKLPKVEVI
ncbi:MAG: MalY/PatB family protein, partial [Promethearchaeota archaeon]